MIIRGLHLFSIGLFLNASFPAEAGELKIGSKTSLTFEDVDGHELATAGGHVTIITVVTQANGEKARAVADQVPDRYIGDPKYRYVTLVNFQGKLPGVLHGITRATIRGRLDAEAKELKPQYEAKHLTRDPRQDTYVIADFDGKATTELGLSPDATEMEVFLFDGSGTLVRHWTDVPPDDSLAKALAEASK